jgi:proteic killer suppression protein
MIRSFRSKALRNFWEKDDVRGINPNWVKRVAMILDRLDAATVPGDMDIPGLRFHPRRGPRKDRYQVDLTAAWRITFGWQGKDAINVDMLEDHS